MKRTTSLCLALLLTHGLNVFGQDNPQARTESWRLSIKAESFDKLLVQGHLYYFLVYTVTNASQHSRAAQLNIFAVIDRVRDGVNPQKTAGFNQFRKHQLPQWPREHDTREFDNRKAVFRLKRYYDMPFRDALQKILPKYPRPLRPSAKIGTLAPGASVRAVAIFKDIDKQMDYLGIMVKGLSNRVVVRGDVHYIEDRVRMFKYYSPGDKANALENEIQFKGAEWVLLSRKKIRLPDKPK